MFSEQGESQHVDTSVPPMQNKETLLLAGDVCFCPSATSLGHIYSHRGKIGL